MSYDLRDVQGVSQFGFYDAYAAKYFWICAILVVQDIASGCQQGYDFKLTAGILVPAGGCPLCAKLYSKLGQDRDLENTGQCYVLAYGRIAFVVDLPHAALCGNAGYWCGLIIDQAVIGPRQTIVVRVFGQGIIGAVDQPTTCFRICAGFSEDQGPAIEILYTIHTGRELRQEF